MKHINYSKKIGTFIVSLALTTMLATSIWAAGYSIKGNLSSKCTYSTYIKR